MHTCFPAHGTFEVLAHTELVTVDEFDILPDVVKRTTDGLSN